MLSFGVFWVALCVIYLLIYWILKETWATFRLMCERITGCVCPSYPNNSSAAHSNSSSWTQSDTQKRFFLCPGTHKLQPLDLTFFKSLKSNYNAATGNWMASNPGRRISLFEMAGIFNTAYSTSAGVGKAVSGFDAARIWPYNRKNTDQKILAGQQWQKNCSHSSHRPQLKLWLKALWMIRITPCSYPVRVSRRIQSQNLLFCDEVIILFYF